MPWHWLDYAIIAVIGLSVLTGLFRGFVKELIALCVWILAVWLAVTYSPTLDPWLQPHIQDKTVRTAVAFVAILLATIIIGGLFNALLSFILRRSGLSGTDRLLGMGFGFVRGVFIVSFLMVVFKMTGVSQEEYISKSHFYVKFEPMVDWLYDYIPGFVNKVGMFDNKKGTAMKLDTNDIKPGP